MGPGFTSQWMLLFQVVCFHEKHITVIDTIMLYSLSPFSIDLWPTQNCSFYAHHLLLDNNASYNLQYQRTSESGFLNFLDIWVAAKKRVIELSLPGQQPYSHVLCITFQIIKYIKMTLFTISLISDYT